MPKTRMVPVILCLLLIFGSLPAIETAGADNGNVTITATSLNVRSGPGLSYPVAGSVKKGEKFSVIKQEGDWIQISLGGSKKGWVAEWFTSKDAVKPAVSQSSTASTGSITANGLRVRKGPGTNHPVIGSLNSGQAVEILSSNGSWAEIKTPSVRGWVSKEYITVKENKSQSTSSSSPKTNGTVNATSLNVRETPSLSAKTVGQLKKGAIVPVLSQANGWAEITYSGKSAWVSAQFLTFSSATPSNSEKQTPAAPVNHYTGTVTASQLNVRDRNTLDGKVVGSVSKGQSFKILEEQNNWVRIEYKAGKTGWAAGWFFEKKTNGTQQSAPSQSVKNSKVSMLHNGTNIRKGPGTDTSVIYRANQGDAFDILSVEKDWYKIALPNGTTGFVAGWIVTVQGNAPQIEKPGAEKHTKNRTVVIDPGHGGRDNGTTGVRGTLEKTLTLKTAQILYDKLKAAGTNVVLTRNNDTYISLGSRVSSSHYHNADAFISIHYDSINDRTVRGMTTYYYNSKQKPLGEQIHSSVVSKTMLKDRGTRFGDYHVIRENRQTAVLLELGYLSNPAEEMLVNTPQYQETVANGIFEGLARYFKNN
ncbi:SH3 domain-containing protein [Mesobacillus subterraneus]|uniref:N-acetylmuramoyl-L-alanine amidase n=1 Tax=Mesobacillus subterraneus TaxID=285983 RepID=A0A427TJW7_9BACI|nr:SH3 domain-containing protein [Mesobacillus subterraneus]RSD24094.1 N-acetylmuramoyl-L-alanine amidase [Mesobacillus subterraneus]